MLLSHCFYIPSVSITSCGTNFCLLLLLLLSSSLFYVIVVVVAVVVVAVVVTAVIDNTKNSISISNTFSAMPAMFSRRVRQQKMEQANGEKTRRQRSEARPIEKIFQNCGRSCEDILLSALCVLSLLYLVGPCCC